MRKSHGGGYVELPGIRLMASGLPYPQWNNGDVSDSALVDIRDVRRWYRDLGVPWGVRVPAGMEWPYGRHVVTQRLMGQSSDLFRPAPPVPGVTIRTAGPGDLEAVVAADLAAFGGEASAARPWLAPMLYDSALTLALAEDEFGTVATAYTVRSVSTAGPAVFLAGVGVVPRARRRGVGGLISSWLLRQAYCTGTILGHLQPDTDEAARVYARLGFIETSGMDVYVDC